MKKIMLSIIIFILILIPNTTKAFSLGDIFTKGENFIQKGQSGDITIQDNDIQSTVVPIGQALVTVGSLVIALATGVMAIKYLMASPEKKAELKGQLVGLVVATVVIYGAQFIWSMMYDIFKNI